VLLQAGTLGAGNNAALGNVAGVLTMMNNTALQAAANNVVLGNAVTLNAAGTVDTQAFTLSLSGIVSGNSGVLSKTGTGTLNLMAANTVQGGVLLEAGTQWAIKNAALGTGTLTMAVGSYQAFATVRDKGIRPIAATGQYRSPKLPDVPTLIEQGLKAPIARLEGGLALSANSAVPVEILELLSRVAVEGNETPRARALRENFAIPDATKGRADALRMWREDAVQWIREVEALGVKLD